VVVNRISSSFGHACLRSLKHLMLFSSFSLCFYGAKASEPKSSVIQIQNQAEPGTGFFVKIGDKLLFITAKHVLGSSGEQIKLIIPGGDSLTVPLKDQLPISGIDAAVILVRKPLATISPLEASKSDLGVEQPLVVWGYPVSDVSTNSQLTYRKGKYLGSPRVVHDGYSLLYSASTQIGFSGGPIIDDSGNVVGMHGRSESTTSPAGISTRTGNALGIPIQLILSNILADDQTSVKIDEKALALQGARESMMKIYQIMSNSSMSDQIIAELGRAEAGGIPQYCIEMTRSYYYTFFSTLPDLKKANNSLTILKKAPKVNPAYYALGSLVGRKSADFKKSLAYNRILEESGFASYLQYSERRLIDEIQGAVLECSK
jgi:hypothetical protein